MRTKWVLPIAIVYSISFIFGLFAVTISNAQSLEITNGINYLASSQNHDGSWGNETSNTEIFPATAEVVETLKVLNQTDTTNYSDAISWLQNQSLDTTDYLSERIYALSVAGSDKDILLSYLDELVSAWGGYDDYQVNNLDTALALLALKRINYSDQKITSHGLGYLLSTQNSDGGWGFYSSACSGCEADPSDVYMTALVLNTLSQYRTIYNLETAINNGVAYLLTKQNPDSGFGSSPSTVYETALAFLALVESGTDISSVAPQAINYLTSTQLPNGSWNDDPYSTALALRALANVKPNLSVSSADITFSNLTPKVGDTIIVTATIYNEGPAVANNIVVQFFDGDPSAGGVLIGEVTIPSIPAYGSSQASLSWTIPTASARKVFVKVDPLNSIDELDKSDNIASRSVTSANLPDLTIGSTDIGFNPDPPRVGEGINISVRVRNQGESPASNFMVWVYAGDPDQGGLRIGEATYNNLSGGGSGTFQIPWIVAQGVDRITVKVDHLNQVSELNKDNNQAFRFLNSLAPPVQGVDLVAVPNSLSFSPGLPQEGSPVIVAAMVQNNGTYGTTNIVVDFFDGDPSNAMNKIFSTTILILDSGQKEPISFQHVFAKGTHTITMVVDPQNLISEASETNNTISANLTVLEGTAEEALTIPRNLRGTSTKTSITLQWDAAVRFYFGGYLVYRDGVLLNTVPIQHETYSDIGLPSGTLFHYEVSSVASYLPGTYGDESPKSVPLAISTTINNIDLKVDYKDVTIAPEDAKAGQTVTISARIHNLGIDPISSGADVRIYTKEALIATLHTPSLAGGGESLVQAAWAMTDPNDFIYIEADPDNVLLEQDEFNNLAIVSIIRNVRFTEFNQVINDSYRAMGDLNNDGALDVLDASGGVLLVNDGQGNFTALRPDKTGFRTGRDYSSAFGDIDNDGYLDVFTCSTTGDNRLYKNNGNLTFTEITQQAGLKGINIYTVNAVFGDLNNDGYLDLFVGTFGGEQYIYLNNGDGTFRRIPGFSEGYENVELGDLDGDGYLDVVVCNGSAVIYKNDGTGHFTRHQDLPGTSSWDVALGDMDNDGYLDIVTLDGRVFFNDGHGNFSLANSVALPRSGVYTINLADFDHNGYLDILYSDTGVLIRNDGNRNFTDITPLNRLNLPWYTVVLGDIDNDGDIDIVGGQYIYKNEMNDNNYLIISLRGKRSNYYGIGSKISVYEEGHLGERDHLKGFRQVQAGGQGYVSQDSSNAHFGVNSNYKYDVQAIFPASKIVVNRRSTSTGQKLILPEIGDLTIGGNDITFSPAAPIDGEKVIITAQVHNLSAIDMGNVVVGFYDGNPTTGGMELGRVEMAYVPAEGVKAFPLEVTLSEGVHEIYVLIDPDHGLLETDTGNNMASRTITISPRIIDQDLSIDSSGIGLSPSAPWEGALVIISAEVQYIGTKEIQNVPVAFYEGDPTQGGILIGQAIIPSISANATAQAQIQWNTSMRSGQRYIHVTVDPLNLIRETNENNNAAIISVEVASATKPDLAIASSDIVFSRMNPNEGEPLVISATVHNLSLAVGNVEVSLCDGDPSAGGMLLAKSSNMPIIPSGGTATLSFNVNTVGLSGDHNFFISVDPDNKIDEMLETNNIASNLITIGQSGLSLGILTDKSAYTASEDIQITVNLNNLLNANRSGALEVKILDLSGNVVSTVVNNQALTLGPNEKRTASYLWNTSQTLSDGYEVYCDFIEAGNVIARAETPITITPVKEIGSSIYPDKISYLSNRPVSITSTIQSASPNYIFSSLVARIGLLNSQGATLFSDMKTIPLLTSGQRVELKTYWNTSINPRGTYAVRLEVLEGVSLLSTSTATFEILGSSQTNEGTLGTITAQPNLVYQGEDEILSYSITNKGNEDISDISVKVMIVNPDTQEVKNTLESTINLPMGTTSTGNFITSTSDLPPRTYLAILQASSATTTQAKTIASTAFMVIQAVTLPFSDNFDSHTVGASPPAPWFELCDGQAVITSAESYSGQNSIMTGGGPGNSHCALVGLGETYPDRISYEVRAKVNAAGSSAYIGFFEEIGDMVPPFNAVYFNGTEGKIYFYSADKDHGFLVPLLDSFAVGVWYKVRVEIDFSKLVGDIYINDVLVGQDLPVSPKEAEWEYNGPHSFQLNKIGVLHYLGEPFYFDDFSVFGRRNHPPIADAGPNMAIFSKIQYSTVIQGMASDPDNDPLSYRWLEGANELISWRPAGPNGECYLDLGSLTVFTLGEHILSLEVNDGNYISRDDMILTVNNSAPHPAPAGGGVCEINTQFPLKGQISDYDGDIVDYGWSEGDHLLFGGLIQTLYGGTPVNLPEYLYQCSVLGEHTVNLLANDGVNQTVKASILISVADTSAPTLAPAPDKNILWPPNHKMVTVSIQANARDNSGGPVLLSAAVFSNEPQNGLGNGDTSPDWTEPVIDQVNGVITLQLRAERSGSGDGRVYTVRITATDTSGNSSYGDVKIMVPHDQGKK